MNDAEPIAEFRDYAGLVAALRLARERRNVSFETLDKVAGLSRGYASKVLSPNGSRGITLRGLGWLMAGLGLKAVLIDDNDALRRINGRMVPRQETLVRSGAITLTLSRRFLSKIGRKGATSRWAKAKQRAAIARHAANARWNGNGGDREAAPTAVPLRLGDNAYKTWRAHAVRDLRTTGAP